MKKQLIYFSSILVILSMLFSDCKKKKSDTPSPSLPSLTTDSISNISQVSALSGGKITSDGGSAITSRGLCWSKNLNPTILDSKTTEGTGRGSFTSIINNLNNNTTYYVRSYATNSVGTAYGDQLVFTTGTFTDIDGNIYHMVTIGNQTWMVENLKTSRFRNGDPIPFTVSNLDWSNLATSSFAYTNNDPNNLNVHGRLYNWYATNDPRNICPKGWHMPSDSEWNQLLTSLGGSSVAGGKMKATGTTYWNSPNTGADNTSGFNGLASGTRDYDGSYKEVGRSAYYWSSTQTSVTNATGWYLFYNYSSMLNGSYNKKDAFIVRCIKD